MPTGYTACIEKGVTFQKFALGCARAFGALILMRDDPQDAPIPETIEPSDYHAKAQVEAEQELRRLSTMSAAEMTTSAANARRVVVRAYEDRREERVRLREKYDAMLVQAHAWTPPTADHQGLKDFMVNQIAESARFDCSCSYDTLPPPQSPGEWHVAAMKDALRNVEYHRKNYAEEVERCRGRTEWVRALRESLAAPTRPAPKDEK